MIRTFVPAPWHVTLEFRNMHNKMWMNARVYTETQQVVIEGKLVPGISTGVLSKPDGKDIPATPEFFPQQRYSSVKSGWQKSTFVYVPIKAAAFP